MRSGRAAMPCRLATLRCAAFAVLVALATAVPTFAQQLLVNPSFTDVEDDAPVGWTSTAFAWFCEVECGDDLYAAAPGGSLRFGSAGLDASVSQVVTGVAPAGLDAFVLGFSVRRPGVPDGSYSVEVLFQDVNGVLQTALRYPASGFEAAEDSWDDIELRLDRSDVPTFDDIAQIEVVLYGVQDPGFSSGHFGPEFDDVYLVYLFSVAEPVTLSWSGPSEIEEGVRTAFDLTRSTASGLLPTGVQTVALTGEALSIYDVAGNPISEITFLEGVAMETVYVEGVVLGPASIRATLDDEFAEQEVTVSVASTPSLYVSAPQTMTAGVRTSFAVARSDVFGNPVVTGTASVGLVGEGLEFFAAEQGGTAIEAIDILDGESWVGLYVVSIVAGQATLRVSLGESVADADLLVEAAAPAEISFVQQPPSSVGVDAPFGAVLEVRDAFGNLATNAQGEITLRMPGFFSDGSSLDGWTASSGIVVDGALGNPTPSIDVPGGARYAFRQLTGLGPGSVIEVDARVRNGSLVNFYFATDANGGGQMFRFDSRQGARTGVGTTGSWASWSEPPVDVQPDLVGGRWYRVRLELGATTVVVFMDGVLKGTSNYTPRGAYVALHGDGLSGGWFDNLRVTGAGENALTGTRTLALEQGVAIFDDVASPLVFAGATLIAEGFGLTATSQAFTVAAGPPATLTAIAGTAQSGAVAAALPTPISVQVRDAAGNPVPGAAVAFTTLDGSVSSASATTDSTGVASVTWTLPTTIGTKTLRASVDALTVDVAATAVAGPLATLEWIGGPTLTAGQRIPLIVRRYDAYGNMITIGSQAFTTSATGGEFYAAASGGSPTTSFSISGGNGGRQIYYVHTVAGSFTATATAGAATVDLALTVVPAGVSAAGSTLGVSPASVPVGGGEATLTVTARDVFGNRRTTGGSVVAIVPLTGTATVGPVTNVGDGTYTAVVTAPNTAGTATFGATLGGVRVRGGEATDQEVTVTFAPGVASAATSLVSVDPPQLIADGASTAVVTLRLRDAYDNDTTALGGDTPTFTTSAGALLGSPSETEPGVWTQSLQAGVTVGTAVVSASLGAAAVDATATLAFVAGPVATLSVVAGDAQTGEVATPLPVPLRVRALDAFGNRVAGAVVAFAAAGDGAAQPAQATTDVLGEAETTWTLPTAAGSSALTASSGDATATFGAEAEPGPTAALALSAAATATAGVRTPFTVARSDAFGNPVAAGAESVDLAGEGLTFFAAAQGGTAIVEIEIPDGAAEAQAFLVSTLAGSTTLLASSGAIDAEADVDVEAAATARLAVAEAPTSARSGALLPSSVRIAFEDAFGNAAPPAQPTTVTASVETVGAVLAGTVSASAAAGEAHFDDLVLRGVAGVPITLRFAADGLTSVDAVVTLTAGDPAALALATQPVGGSASGTALATQPVVEIRDAEGNRVLTDDATVVTVAISTGLGGTLTGSLTATAVAGQAAFVDLALAGSVGASYLLSFSAPGRTGVTAQPIGVTPGAAAQLVIVQVPVAAAAGETLPTQPRLEIRDAQGNVVPTDGVVVTATVAAPAVLSGTTAVASAVGVIAFADVVLGGPAATPIAIDFTSTTGLTVAAPPVTLTPGAAASLEIAAGDAQTTTVATVTPTRPTVRVRDAFGNPVAGTTVAFTVAAGGGSVDPATALSDALGLASTAWTLGPTPGVNTLTAAGDGLAGSPLPFTATALSGVPVALAFAATPPSPLAGTPFAVQVRLLDALGNLSLAATTPVTLALSSGATTLAGTLLAVPDGGVATFPCVWLERPAAGVALAATATALPTATSAPFAASGATLSGRLLLDRDGSLTESAGDGSVVAAQVQVLAAGGAPLSWTRGAVAGPGGCTPTVESVTTTLADGRFTIHGLPPGAVTVAIGGAAMTPLVPLFTPPSATLTAFATSDVGTLPAFPGVVIEGRVFRDDGEGGGVANDGVRQANEPGVPGVDLALRVAGTTFAQASGAAGAFTYLVPLAASAEAQATFTPGAGRAATGYRAASVSTVRAGTWTDPLAATATAALGSLTPGERWSFDLGLVPRATIAFEPGDGFVQSPGSLRTPIVVHPGTDATVRVTASGGVFSGRLDPDPATCPGLTVTSAGTGVWLVAANAAWPRAALGTAPCRLVHAVVVPSGVAGGTQDTTNLRVDVLWRHRSGASAVTEGAVAPVTLTVLRGGSLTVAVAARPAGSTAAFAAELPAIPGALVEAQVTFRNPGSGPVSNAVVRVDFGADLLPTDAPAQIACPGGVSATAPLTRVDGATVLSIDLARACGTPTVAAGAVGTILAVVRVR